MAIRLIFDGSFFDVDDVYKMTGDVVLEKEDEIIYVTFGYYNIADHYGVANHIMILLSDSEFEPIRQMRKDKEIDYIIL